MRSEPPGTKKPMKYWRFLVLVDPWSDDLDNSPDDLPFSGYVPHIPPNLTSAGTGDRFGGGYGDGLGFTPIEDMVKEE